jgi:hypothetical protein
MSASKFTARIRVLLFAAAALVVLAVAASAADGSPSSRYPQV